MPAITLDPGGARRLVTVAGLLQAVIGWWAVRRYSRRRDLPATWQPPITILKPLHGDEPMLEQALASFCAQDYPSFQIVFGLQDAADPALHVIRRLRARFPQVDIEVVIDPAQHGVNRKISNLINMYPRAKHDVIVMADSDIHAPPDYLRQLASGLAQDGRGPGHDAVCRARRVRNAGGPAGRGADQPQLPARRLAGPRPRPRGLPGCHHGAPPRDAGGVGGLHALVHHLADDAVLGRLVTRAGETRGAGRDAAGHDGAGDAGRHLFAHELRWGRTIQSLAPVGFALSSLQYPLFWAALGCDPVGFQPWSIALFVGAWLVRAAAMIGIDAALGLPPRCRSGCCRCATYCR